LNAEGSAAQNRGGIVNRGMDTKGELGSHLTNHRDETPTTGSSSKATTQKLDLIKMLDMTDGGGEAECRKGSFKVDAWPIVIELAIIAPR